MIVSGIALFLVLTAQSLSVLRRNQKQGAAISVSKTSDDLLDGILSLIELMIPNYNESYTLVQAIVLFLLSFSFQKTRSYEEQESTGKTDSSLSSTEPIENIETMRNYQVQRAVQLIKDYKFKAKLAVQAEIILLAFISSVSCTVLVLPYAILFLTICLTLSMTGQSKAVSKVSRSLNLVFISLLLVDLPAKYLIKGSHFVTDNNQQRFFNEVIGLLSSTPTYFEFYLKILLFLVECQKIQYSYNYQDLFDQIKQAHSEKYELSRIFRKRISFNYKIFKPISIFIFSALSILFALCHPSMILLGLMPIFIFGFFLTQVQYKGLSKIIVLLFALFLLASQISQIVYLVLPSNQTKEDYIVYAEKILGIRKNVSITSELFPTKLDFFFLLVLAFFSSYISKNKSSDDQEPNSLRMNSLLKDGFEEDILTIPDDISEIRSRISYKVPPNLPHLAFSDRVQTQIARKQNIKSFDTTEIIIEENKEEDDLLIEQESKTLSTQIAKKKQQSRSIWNSQRDETLRGKIRRQFFKAYLKMRVLFDKFVNLLTIHSSKFSLFVIFLVSVWRPNLLNATLFIVFLWLAVTDQRNIRSNWKYPIFVDSIIMMFLYTLDVFTPKEIFEVDPKILEFIGVSVDQDNATLQARLSKYFPYIGLLIVLVLTHYIINSEKFDQYIHNLLQLERDQHQDFKRESQSQGDGEDHSFIIVDRLNYIGLTDRLSKFIVQHSIYFLLLAMFIQCSLPPASLLNFILLILLLVVLIKFFYSDTQIVLYKKLSWTLKLIKWISFLVLFLKYMMQFQDLIQNLSQLSNEDLSKFKISQAILEKIMGVDRSQYISVKLFSLALVMVISNYQLTFSHHPLLQGILKEQEIYNNNLIFLDPKMTNSNLLRLWHHVKIYLLVFTQIALFPIPMILLLSYALKLPSLIGFLLILSLVAILKFHQEEFWQKYYQSLGVATSISFVLVYSGYFSQIFIVEDIDFLLLQWVGIKRLDKHQDFVFYPQMNDLFIIIMICGIQKYLASVKISFSVTLKQEDFQRVELLVQENNEETELELIKMNAIYRYEQPMRVLQFIKERVLKVLFFIFGFQIMIICAMTVILTRLDFVSIQYAIMIVIIMRSKYFPMLYKESQEERSIRSTLVSLLHINIGLISFVAMNDYGMSIGPAYRFDIISWKDKLTSYLCYEYSTDCSKDWQQWLALSDIAPYYIMLDFIYLTITYLNLFFIDEKIILDQDQIKQTPKINDERDFLSNNYQGSRLNHMFCQMLFNSFPYVLILALMVFATMFHGSGSADLISTVYLFHAFYYIVNFRKLYTKNTSLLSYLRYFNAFVLFAVIVFQSPLFICPSVQSFQGTFNYIRVQQCSQLLTDNLEDQKYSSTNSYLAIYIVLTQSIGFIKIYSLQYDFIILMAVVELQDYLFNHPFFQVYVLQHMRLEKETDSKLRAFMFVEQTHLGVLWSYKAIKEEIRILHQRLIRINQVIKDHEHSKLFFLEGEEEASEKDQLLDPKQKSGKLNLKELSIFQEGELLQPIDENERAYIEEQINLIVEEMTIKIEDTALSLLSMPNSPIIPLKLFLATFRQYLMNSEAFQSIIKDGKLIDQGVKDKFIEDSLLEILKKLQKYVYDKHRHDLYQKEGIGLNFVLQKGSDTFPRDFEEQFLVRKDYEDIIEMNDQFKVVQSEGASFLQRINFFFRSLLWMNYINKHLFYSLTQDQGKKIGPYDIPFFKLLSYSILSQSQNICYLVLFLNFIVNPSILTLLPPLSALLYSLLDYPVPTVRYWKFLMIYMFLTVALKFIYQLPIFCGTPPYSLFSIEGCQTSPIPIEILFNRIDYIIGIRKFAGPSSYPRDQGILQGMIGDILVLLTLLVLKNYLIKIGLWHFVKTKNNIYLSPAFKCKTHELSQSERLQMLRKENYKVYEYEQAKLTEKVMIRLSQAKKSCQNFVLKLMPQFMATQQRNLDLRTQDDQEFIVHNPKRVKPGKDYFSQNFFALLMILIYNLLWYRSVTGENQTVALSSANLQRFSSGQVILLFVVLVLMMIERMLFRTRYFDSKNSFASSSLLSKHQLTAKLALHVILVISVHIWLGFVVPRTRMEVLQRKSPLIFAYLIWVYYFISSANQIRHGYPQAPFKPPFTRDTSFFNWWSFRVFKAIPFLWEMKVIVDWTVTSTSLDLYQWFKIDDAFNYLYQNQQQNNDRRSRPEFQQRPWYEKFFQGFCFAFGMILVILAPILLFSGINPIMVKNPVLSGQLSMFFELNANGNTYSILHTQAFRITQVSDQDVIGLSKLFSPIYVQFNPDDMQKMLFSPYSEVEWSISPPSLKKFVDDFNDIKDQNQAFVDVKSVWNFKRNNPIGNEAVQSETKIRMSASKLQPIIDLLSNDQHSQIPSNLTDDLKNNKSTIYVENIFPKVLKLGSTQQASMLEIQPITEMPAISSIALTLNRVNNQNLYWTFSLQNQQGIFSKDQQATSKSQQSTQTAQQQQDRDQDMVLIVYNEEVIGAIFGSAFQFSVVGLYATIVIAIGRFLRLMFDRISQRVIYEEMKNTELLFEICEGIFIAQVEGDLVKEKRLYELLISMYRSPETLIKMTGINRETTQMRRIRKDSGNLLGDKQQ